MSRSRASRVERDAGLERFYLSRVHLVDRPERVGQQASHELEPVLGDLDARRFHAVAELIQGHTRPSRVWEDTATSIPTGSRIHDAVPKPWAHRCRPARTVALTPAGRGITLIRP